MTHTHTGTHTGQGQNTTQQTNHHSKTQNDWKPAKAPDYARSFEQADGVPEWAFEYYMSKLR